MTANEDGDGYPPIGDYAVIGDCHTIALISRAGSVDWFCLPHFSGPAVFAALLDRKHGGRFAVRPAGAFTASRRYVGETNVLETTFRTDTGVLRLTDFMPVADNDERGAGLQPQAELLRIVEVLEGEAELELVFEPRPDYARAECRLARRGELGWCCERGSELFLLRTTIALEGDADGRGLRTVRKMRAGERHCFSFSYESGNPAVLPALGEQAQQRLGATLQWWRSWSDQCTYEGPYRDAVIRSALTLKLLTYALSGAVIAAATSSLPERIGGALNWDYRYCWLRDASLTLQSFVDFGWPAEAEAFLSWLLHATRLTRPRLQVLYDLYGESNVTERTLDHLQGYGGSRPVRIGNQAHSQLQLDVYGAVVLAAYDYVDRGGRLDHSEAALLADIGKVVCEDWQRPDHGIWEERGEPRQHTFSKLMCWVALDRLLRLHSDGHIGRIDAARLRAARDDIRDAIGKRAFNEQLRSYVGIFDGEELDAACLLLLRFGFCAADDPRMRSTFEAIERELGCRGLLFRYSRDIDDAHRQEGAFGICSFWAVDCLVRFGRDEDARRTFEHLLTFANDVGLYSEQIDPATGDLLGNFPQAFTHVGLLVAAGSLDPDAYRPGRQPGSLQLSGGA